MRILCAIPHYYKFVSDKALYASLHSNKKIKIDSLSQCILNLHYQFGKSLHTLSFADNSAIRVNQEEGYTIDVVVCTTGDYHLLKELKISSALYQHQSTNADPLFLGLECHRIFYENLGNYDYYCYLEDDIIVLDNYFFYKLDWFNFCAGDDCLLQPNRYETDYTRFSLKVYIDGDISPLTTRKFQDREDSQLIEGDLLAIPTKFVRPLNPHSGCFFLNQRQMRFWSEQKYFLKKDASFVGPLESSATLGIMKSFKVYKTIPEQASSFEVMHFGNRYLNLVHK